MAYVAKNAARRALRFLLAFLIIQSFIVAADTSSASAAEPICDGVAVYIRAAAGERWEIPGFWTSDTYSIACTLRSWTGTKAAVGNLQRSLNACYQQQLVVDGVYGPATAQAVANAQTWERVAEGPPVATDGVYGPETRWNIRFFRWPNLTVVCQRLDGTGYFTR